ncbi:unnamed protein product, partial [Rotaria sordida]
MQWRANATSGQVIAGGNGQGSGAHQLDRPTDVIVEKDTDSLIICDSRENGKVVRWLRQNGKNGTMIISNINCVGLAMDENRSLYVSDAKKEEVKRFRTGESSGSVVAGGNGQADRLNQLYGPTFMFVDQNRTVYVSDSGNHRIMKWIDGAREGIVVAGGQGRGNGLQQLVGPQAVAIDQMDTVYVVDAGNNRIMRWPKGASQGTVIIGQEGQLNFPV